MSKALQKLATNVSCGEVDPLPFDSKIEKVRVPGKKLNSSLAFRLRKFSPLVVAASSAKSESLSPSKHNDQKAAKVAGEVAKSKSAASADIVPDIHSVTLAQHRTESNTKKKYLTSKKRKGGEQKHIQRQNDDASADVGEGNNETVTAREEANTEDLQNDQKEDAGILDGGEGSDEAYQKVVEDQTQTAEDLVAMSPKTNPSNQDDAPQIDMEAESFTENSHLPSSFAENPNEPSAKPDEQAKSDIATNGELLRVDDFDLALPKTEPIYTLPDLPGSRVFYNQAKQILKEAGLKTRKDELERQTLLQKKGSIFNKYTEIRKVLGYGPNLGIQREYQQQQQAPGGSAKVITVPLRKHIGVKSAADALVFDRPDRTAKGINVIRNSSKQVDLPDLFTL